VKSKTNVKGFVRGFDARTGKTLWETKLDTGANTNPITFMVHGKQYVVIVSSGVNAFTIE